MPADESSPILPALDQLREHPRLVPEEVPGLLERLAEIPDPRDPRGVRGVRGRSHERSRHPWLGRRLQRRHCANWPESRQVTGHGHNRAAGDIHVYLWFGSPHFDPQITPVAGACIRGRQQALVRNRFEGFGLPLAGLTGVITLSFGRGQFVRQDLLTGKQDPTPPPRRAWASREDRRL
ncbi:hypothetical protein [Streptomyces sp. NBC_00316]|uniref:hypothetical protein n=1 Tax=Streptomyces sp. NBC_00316 TaxID=2975710 RepID=UPI002E2A2359|nr:hypothetical protein [Streptomyces sp. NBC_00316]